MIIIWLLTQAFYAINPYLVNKLLTVIETHWEQSQFYMWSRILLVFIVLMVISDRIQWLIWDYLRSYLFTKRKIEYVREFLDLDHWTVHNLWTWKSITRIEKWTTAEIDIMLSSINLFINSFFRGLLIFFILLYLEPTLALVMFITFLAVVLFDRIFYRYLKPLTKQNTAFNEEAWRQTVKLVMEHGLIWLTSMKESEIVSHKKHMDIRPPLEAKLAFFQYTPMDIIFLWIKLVERWIYFWLGWQVYIWQASFAYMVMVVGYIMLLWGPLEHSLHQFARINRQTDAYLKLRKFITQPNTVLDWTKRFKYKKWDINFSHLDFSYNQKKKILSDFNLRIIWWKTTALVWHSWSWKSTLIKLILRQYDPQVWSISIDWQKLTSLKKDSYYPHIGFVSQEPSVFDWTILENITYWLPISKFPLIEGEDLQSRSGVKFADSLEQTIKAAHCEFVYDLENWLHSQIWEKWVKLSWWEKQRIAIARLMLRNPEIIVLDEPTSALDSISEDHITSALKELTKNKTVIVIAHRLQTVQHADNIVVMEKWSIIEQWNHQQLLSQWWIYSTLVDLQNWRIKE